MYFWQLIIHICSVSGGMVGLFWRNMMFLIQFSSFWLFSGGKHGFVYPPRSPDMNTRLWFIPSSMPFSLLFTSMVLGESSFWFRFRSTIQFLPLWSMDVKAEAEPKPLLAKYYPRQVNLSPRFTSSVFVSRLCGVTSAVQSGFQWGNLVQNDCLQWRFQDFPDGEGAPTSEFGAKTYFW